MPSASRWKRLLVRNGSPSPANIRVGSSFSRLNANTPPVNGKLPGTFSRSCQRRISPSSSYRGSATLRTLVPDSDVVVSAVRISLSRIFTTYSSPPYAASVCGHMSSSFRARASSCASRSLASSWRAVKSDALSVAFSAVSGDSGTRIWLGRDDGAPPSRACSIACVARSCCRSRAMRAWSRAHLW